MKDNKDIIIDGLMARIRELEVDVTDRNYSLEVVGRFIKETTFNKLSEEQSKELNKNLDDYIEDMPCSGAFDFVETDPDVFIEIMNYMLNR